MKALLLAATAALALAGCKGDAAGNDRMLQTHFPGMVTAGGHTSGEVMAANTPRAAVNPGPAGTPGIPGGAGGNTGGAGLATSVPKTTDIAANTTAPAGVGAPASAASAAPAPAAAASTPLSAASAAALQAQQAQRELERSQDLVADRWKTRAAGGAFANAAPRNPLPSDTVVRSEKFGTAPPSPDVKTLTKPVTKAEIVRKSPDAAGPKP